MSDSKEDPKKDLTNLLDLIQNAPPPTPGAEAAASGEGAPLMEPIAIEQVAEFESLDDFAKKEPAPEIPTDTSMDPPPAESPVEGQAADSFPITESPAEFATTEATPSTGDGNFDLNLDFAQSDSSPQASSGLDLTFDAAAPEPAAVDAEPIAEFEAPPVESAPPQELPALEETPPQKAAPPPAVLDAIQKVKEYSERIPVGRPAVPAEYPFSLLLVGRLKPYEKERLLDCLSRYQMGIREVDLEPQFEAGKILIPRISEYAGVVLIQALRGAEVEMKFGPSDEIFSAASLRDEATESALAPAAPVQKEEFEAPHPAESLPVTTHSNLSGLGPVSVVDVVTATAAIRASTVEAQRSPEFQDVMDALQREVRYKAYRKGGVAVTQFKVTLTPLESPFHYRLVVTGNVVRKAELHQER